MSDWAATFAKAMPYDEFLERHASHSDRARWDASLERVTLKAPQIAILESFTRDLKVLCFAGAWCGDCVEQCPILHRFATTGRCIELKMIDRDDDPDLSEAMKLCGAPRVPQVVFLNEDDQFIAHFGDRTLAKYRRMGASLGGATCATGIVGVDHDATFDDVVQDWLNEFERAHWIVRLSPRLRQRHGD